MPTIYPGDLVRISAVFKNSSNVATDPTAVTAKVKDPVGAVTTYVYGTDAALVRDSAGTYHVDVSVTMGGKHVYRFAGTGTCQAAEESSFTVEQGAFS